MELEKSLCKPLSSSKTEVFGSDATGSCKGPLRFFVEDLHAAILLEEEYGSLGGSGTCGQDISGCASILVQYHIGPLMGHALAHNPVPHWHWRRSSQDTWVERIWNFMELF